MIYFESDNINNVQVNLLSQVLKNGKRINVSELTTLELFPVSFKLTNIRNRCTTLFERKWNLFFALGELCWHLHGSNEPRDLEYYTKNWRLFEDKENYNLSNCYGYKIFEGKYSEWNRIKEILIKDKLSRRAVIILPDSSKQRPSIKSQGNPCTTSLQFLVRDEKLHLIVNMRSNDIIWGFPNDVFVFTMLQEVMAVELGLEPGPYYHFVGSLHLYERHFSLASKILNNPDISSFTMPRMEGIKSLKEFLEAEKSLRMGRIESVLVNSEYWNNLLDVLKIKHFLKKNDFLMTRKLIDKSIYREVLDFIPINNLKDLVNNQIIKPRII